MADDDSNNTATPSDEELAQMTRDIAEELERTNGYATDARSRDKQWGPLGEPETEAEAAASSAPKHPTQHNADSHDGETA